MESMANASVAETETATPDRTASVGAPVLRASGVSKAFFRKTRYRAGEFNAVEPCDFTLRKGQLVALTGRSGSGKTTLLNMLAGLLEPTSGSVEVAGTDLYRLPDSELSRFRNEHMGVVPQGQTAIQSITVLENVLVPHSLYRADDASQRAYDLLESLGIAELSESYPAELSGGELRRMAIARALVCGPSIVFADEPTGDLDDENTEIVLGMLRCVANGGAAVLMVTHEQAAANVSDLTLRMDSGHLQG